MQVEPSEVASCDVVAPDESRASDAQAWPLITAMRTECRRPQPLMRIQICGQSRDTASASVAARSMLPGSDVQRGKLSCVQRFSIARPKFPLSYLCWIHLLSAPHLFKLLRTLWLITGAASGSNNCLAPRNSYCLGDECCPDQSLGSWPDPSLAISCPRDRFNIQTWSCSALVCKLHFGYFS